MTWLQPTSTAHRRGSREIVGPCLEKICDAASGRKYLKLRHEAKSFLSKLDDALRPPSAEELQYVRRLASLRADPSRVMSRQGNGSLAASVSPAEPAPSVGGPGGAADAGASQAGEALDSEDAAGQEAGSVQVVVRVGADGDQVKLSLATSPAERPAEPQDVSAGSAVLEHAASGIAVALPEPADALSGFAPSGVQEAAEDDISQLEGPVYRGTIRLASAQELLEILRMAVETRKVQLVDIALDCIQKLLAHQHLAGPVYTISHKRDTGSSAGRRKARPTDEDDELEQGGSEAMPPQAQAVELLCRCDDIPDDGIELRILKGLLTAVTSSSINVHGQALLLAVRTCYNIFLMSRSEVNQTTAKASLTQMLNVVFQRMEAGSEHVHVAPIMVSDVLGLPSTDSSSMSAFVQAFLHEVVTAVDAATFGYRAEGIQAGLDDAFIPPPPSASSHGYVTEQDSPHSPDREHIEWRPSPSPARSSANDLSGAGQPNSPVPAQPGNETTASAAAGPMLQLPSETGSAEAEPGFPVDTSAAATPLHAPGRPHLLTVQTVLQKDAFLVFRALCKLSIRTSESSSGTDVTAVRGKVLALELLKILLENSGPVFRQSEKFVSAIKQYLCLSLLKNAASTIPQALALSCSIFYTLMTKFRTSLKAEIGVFFPMIMLRAIEPAAAGTTPNAAGPGGVVGAVDVGHKAVVMRCLEAQCENGQLLVDLFVNYDCDLEGANLYERLVVALVRIAQGNQEPDTSAQAAVDEAALRRAALQCLVNILRSLVEWYTLSTPSVAAPAMDTAVEPATADHDAVQKWETLTSTNTAAGEVSTEAPGEVPEPGSPGRPPLKREISERSYMAALASVDGELPQQLRDADSAREAAMLESWKAYKKGFHEGVTLFNKKPKKGIAFMQEQGMLGRSGEDVAKFLAKTAGLNKTLIGEYLGEREDFCLKVMHCYVDAMDFEGAEFDAAIRTFLNGFRLPGEAQKIDRLMEKFAERYVHCNAEAFKSADVAYVLAYSVIMLNTDAHNPQVKVKMSKQDFLRNNRGINDGGDLDEEYMTSLYDRIVNNEIKMKDSGLEAALAAHSKAAAGGGAGGGWMDTILNLIPGRKQQASNEPSDDSIRRTHEYLRERAKGQTFFEATEGETVRPMLDVSWAPMLGAFSVLFEEYNEGTVVNLCLAGFVAAIRITCLLGMGMLRNTFVTSVARFTMLHAPAAMHVKNAKAFRALLVVADENGNHLHDVWQEVLRCVSRFELLQQVYAGGPTDAALFAQPLPESPSGAVGKLRSRFLGGLKTGGSGRAAMPDSFTSIHDAPLHHPGPKAHKSTKGDADAMAAPPEAVLREIDAQELNRMFVRSDRLDSEAIVEFVRALCAAAREELQPVASPRIYSMTKIVEVAHFNMNRIRLVWGRIWAVLSDFFVEVGCHRNLQVAIHAVDSLRQLAMKFLERDELANYTFQNDFLKPFVVVMRQSKAVEIRELIIRCVSQMVLARVANVKSGWKSMFMVFTTAANDEQQTIVRLAFETIEKIVREHFDYITETEITTFTDCVNCLIAFTNNPHSLDVSLNAIAFLRFCAMKLAEGAIGDVEELPEGTQQVDANTFRIRPTAYEPDSESMAGSRRSTWDGEPSSTAPPLPAPASNGALHAPGVAEGDSGQKKGLQFSDKDEHMYFWFPLLAGLSELTFDPRPDIRYSALEVLFDTLKFHGAAFTLPFWTRIFDSVLLPIFDHVRAEVTDTTTFTDEKRRTEVEAWLYETCTQCLQHMVDVVVQFYPVVQPLLGRMLDLLSSFIRRTHQSLAAVGVAALVRLLTSAGSQMSSTVWQEAIAMLAHAVSDTRPHVAELLAPASRRASHLGDAGEVSPSSHSPSHLQHAFNSEGRPTFSLAEGAGARRLTEAEDHVAEARMLVDPPLLRLESEACHAYLSMLLHLQADAPAELQEVAEVEARLFALCTATLERFQASGPHVDPAGPDDVHINLASQKEEFGARSPLTVATLRALLAYPDQAFRAHLKSLFPLLTQLISCQHAPPEVQRTLSDLFAMRIGPLLQGA
ncbi:hypothetical protein WJX72_005963 [[Myrmecia] bisecta]|uniref:SEC7 domain-containing protein n=1 Tax=[Myrmecia] bisecta TaxID=41462 RepID=A0AAW1R7D8_9CHLO